MGRRSEADFAEVTVDRLILESFSNEDSAYFKKGNDADRRERLEQYRSRLKWHVSRSLSHRQKQVISLYLKGKKQREIASLLGITQQVVSIYKKRAVNKLRMLVL